MVNELLATSATTPSTATPLTLLWGVAKIKLDAVSVTPVTFTDAAETLEVPATVAIPLRENVATPSTASAEPVPVVDADTAGPLPLVVADSAGDEFEALLIEADTALP